MEFAGTVVRVSRSSAATELAVVSEMAPARNVIHFDADPVGVFEQDRVIARCKMASVFRAVHDRGVDVRFDERVYGFDVFSAARTKAEMMKTCTVLVEALLGPGDRGLADENPGSATDAVDDVFSLDQSLHPHEIAEALPEGEAALGVQDC